MPFLDHLEELRWRIIYSLGSRRSSAVGIGFWVTLHFDLVGILARPILPHPAASTSSSSRIRATDSPSSLNTAMTIGLVLAGPVILYQVWLFLSPALHKHEKRVGIGVLFAGDSPVHLPARRWRIFVVVPLALPWLLDFGRTVDACRSSRRKSISVSSSRWC